MDTKRITPTQFMNSWRLGNAVILLSSLLLPWIVSWSDIAPYSIDHSNGFDELFLPKTVMGTRLFIEEMLPGKFLPMLGGSIVNAVVPMTAIGYSLFCVTAHFNNRFRRSSARRNSIWAFFILLLIAYPVWHISYGIGFNNKLSWGYYMVIFGFISSALLELCSIFWIRDQQRNLKVESEVPEAG